MGITFNNLFMLLFSTIKKSIGLILLVIILCPKYSQGNEGMAQLNKCLGIIKAEIDEKKDIIVKGTGEEKGMVLKLKNLKTNHEELNNFFKNFSALKYLMFDPVDFTETIIKNPHFICNPLTPSSMVDNLHRKHFILSHAISKIFSTYPDRLNKTLEKIYSEPVNNKNPFYSKNFINDFWQKGPPYLGNCANVDFLGHLIRVSREQKVVGTQNYNLLPLNKNCVSDFAYSYQSLVNLYVFKKRYNKNTNWEQGLNRKFVSQKNELYLSYSPIASFGYGKNVIRLRFKKDAKFYLLDFKNPNKSIHSDMISSYVCSQMTAQQKRDFVIVRYFKTDYGFSEYIICSMGPVHSYSFNNREIYNELLRDFFYYLKTYQQENKTFLYGHDYEGPQLFLGNLDKQKFDISQLVSTLSKIKGKIPKGPSKKAIFLNPAIKVRKLQDIIMHKNLHWNSNKEIHWSDRPLKY